VIYLNANAMKAINQTLDAAILKPEMTETEVIEALNACLRYVPATVCVRPCDIELAQDHCRDAETGVCVVLGFPHGDQLSASKADEARRYCALGVDEIDMVVNFGWVKSGKWDAVHADIAAVTAAAKPTKTPVKVIFESCFLSVEEIERLTEVCVEAGADYVKTSTGFNGPGATEEAVAVMVKVANGRIAVKASGGIRDAATAQRYLELGATRLGVGYGSVAALCSGEGASTEAY
jgi:deoxyribose-phosphate aldolase